MALPVWTISSRAGIRDRLYLIEGTPRTGKTTLALQFLLEGSKKGETGLYVTLSESEKELRVVAARHGWSLDGLSIFELISPRGESDPDHEQTLFHPAELELSETTKLILDCVTALKPLRVVFDSLSEMRLLAQNPITYRRQILALKHFFSGRNCYRFTRRPLLECERHPAPQYRAWRHTSGTGGARLWSRTAPAACHKDARNKIRGGYHDFTIQTGGIAIYPRLVASEHHKAFIGEKTQSGSAELDALLGGGLPRGTSALLIGGAGVGKSSVAITFAVAAAERGENASIFAFDEGLGTLYARAAGLGIPLQAHVGTRGASTFSKSTQRKCHRESSTHRLVRGAEIEKAEKGLRYS